MIIDGIDGSGKSTLIQALGKKSKKFPDYDGVCGKQIYKHLHGENMGDMTKMFELNYTMGLQPGVVYDRHWPSNYAYSDKELSEFRTFSNIPVVILDIDVETSLARIESRNDPRTVTETRERLERARARYLSLSSLPHVTILNALDPDLVEKVRQIMS